VKVGQLIKARGPVSLSSTLARSHAVDDDDLELGLMQRNLSRGRL
jgi:hypothetical protein